MSHKIVSEWKLLTSQLENLLSRSFDPTEQVPEPTEEQTEDIHQVAYNLAQVACNLSKSKVNYMHLAADMAQVSSDLAKLASTLSLILVHSHPRRESASTDSSMTPLQFDSTSEKGPSVDDGPRLPVHDLHIEEILPSPPLTCTVVTPDLVQVVVCNLVDQVVDHPEQEKITIIIDPPQSQPEQKDTPTQPDTPPQPEQTITPIKKISWDPEPEVSSSTPLPPPTLATVHPPLKKIMIRRKK